MDNRLKAIIIFLICLPNVLWIFLTHGSWVHWDQSAYALNAITLWQTLLAHPLHWGKLMITIMPCKAPLLIWIAQFFVPLGIFLHSVDVGLLLLVYLLHMGTVFFVYSVVKRLFGKDSVAILSSLFLCSGSLFIQTFSSFYTESVGACLVAGLLYVMIKKDEMQHVSFVFWLFVIVGLSVLNKLLMPLYMIVLLVAAGRSVFKRKIKATEMHAWLSAHPLVSILFFAIGLFGLAWYAINFGTVVVFSKWSAQSLLWGIPQSFFGKVAYWTSTLFAKTVIQGKASVVIGVVVVAVVWDLVRKKKIPELVVLSCAQVFFVIVVFSLSNNQFCRLLVPLLPYVAIVFAWLVQHSTDRRIICILFLLVLVQYGYNYQERYRPLYEDTVLLTGMLDFANTVEPGSTIMVAWRGRYSPPDIEYYIKKKTTLDKPLSVEGASVFVEDTVDADRNTTEKSFAKVLARCPDYFVVKKDQRIITNKKRSVSDIYEDQIFVVHDPRVVNKKNMPMNIYEDRLVLLAERVQRSNYFEEVPVTWNTPLVFYKLKKSRVVNFKTKQVRRSRFWFRSQATARP